MAVNWAAIEEAGVRAAMAAMTAGANKVSARAKELAPVRKVFEGQDDNYKIRLKKISEIKADAPARARLGLGAENPYVYPPTIVSKRAPQHLQGRGIVRLQKAPEPLDRRGRYELKTQRAAHKGDLGGRLRDEIYATEASLDGKIIRCQVVSPTEYAKYQELGSRHNPAHPYLRPAGHEMKSAIRSDVARSVSAAAKPLFRGYYVVTARFKSRGVAA